ncbi:uncharacterized protein LOC133198703 [Saccostrea echinata]|uniref:uncharacterized protein LOC133198703 n=1 Tax=Saccostrea echinata TaxID=191078 RepID=UPI002A81759F|nr:uncharacterized protein LOC133198703 [Saccostrea echinata]
MPPQQILACVFVMNASCSNWCFSENGECLPTFLVELPKCIVECEMLMGGEILFMINKWESVMTTHEDTEKFEDDAWFNIKHTIITALGRQRINQDNIYRVSLGKQMRHENDERLCREYTRFEDTVCGILEKRNTENLSALKTIAIQCRSIMKKKLKKMKKEKSKHKKWESDLKGSLTKLENVCPPVVETEESESDLEEKFIRNSKKRKKKSDDST